MKNDEYGMLPPEYATPGDEFNEPGKLPDLSASRQAEEAKKKKKHKRLLAKMLMGTVTTVTIFSTTPAWENVAGNDNNQIVQDDTYVETDINDLTGITDGTDGSSGLSVSGGESSTGENKENMEKESDTASSVSASTGNEPVSEEDSLLYCGDCYGTGMCSTCHNNGYIQCGNISDGCSLCSGSGVRICPSCGGNGSCASCGGSGDGSDIDTRYNLCSNCNGKGILCGGSAAADDPDGCDGAVVSICKACGNTGMEADGSPCSWCKGTLRHLCPSFEVHRNCPDCNGSGVVLLSN